MAEASKSGLMWMHVYIAKDRNLTESIIRRAEAAGFKAIVLTVDQPGPGKTVERLIRAVPSTSLPIVGLTNMSGNVNYEIDPSVTWKDVDWIRSVTQLPIVMKGILTAEDAVEATKHGIQGVIVSNHGKRLLEGSLATVGYSFYSYSFVLSYIILLHNLVIQKFIFPAFPLLKMAPVQV